MKCVCCGSCFKKSKFNPTDYCEACIDEDEGLDILDEDAVVEMQHIINPSGKVQPVFYD